MIIERIAVWISLVACIQFRLINLAAIAHQVRRDPSLQINTPCRHIGPHARYFGSVELNFERVPVPGVTTQTGTPAVGASGVVSFARTSEP